MNRVLEIPMSVQEVDNINMTLSEDEPINMGLETVTPGGGGGGTNDYEQLVHKPSINTHELVGDKDGNELGLINSNDNLGIEEIDRMFAAVFGN